MDPNAPKWDVALRSEIALGELSGLDLITTPGADWETTGAGARLKSNFAGFDLSISTMRIASADRMVLGLKPKMMAGMDLAGQICEIGVWSELAGINPVLKNHPWDSYDSLYIQADLGLDYTLDNGTYLVLEYYFNQKGHSNQENYSSGDLLSLMGGDMSGFGKNYLFTGLSRTFLDYWNLNLFCLTNIDDQSAMALPGIQYDFSSDFMIGLNGFFGIGKSKESEYGSMFSSVNLKMKGWF